MLYCKCSYINGQGKKKRNLITVFDLEPISYSILHFFSVYLTTVKISLHFLSLSFQKNRTPLMTPLLAPFHQSFNFYRKTLNCCSNIKILRRVLYCSPWKLNYSLTWLGIQIYPWCLLFPIGIGCSICGLELVQKRILRVLYRSIINITQWLHPIKTQNNLRTLSSLVLQYICCGSASNEWQCSATLEFLTSATFI